MLQVYKSMSRKSDLGKSEILRCPYRFRCNCYVSLKIRYTKDSVILYQAGSHTLDSHANAQRGSLSIKQRGAVKRSVRASPLAAPRMVQDGLLDLSPGKHVAYDKKSQAAVSRLVRKERKEIMHERIPEVDDDTEGSMNRLAESMSLATLIARHNDPKDPFHLDEHEPVCVGHQFADGVTFMTLTTPHLLSNMARAVNCGWQKQGHFDGAFNWCRKDFAMIGFGMNSMGAHFNPVSLSIVNSESKEALKASYEATVSGLYLMYKTAKICENPEKCGFCSNLMEQLVSPKSMTREWKAHLTSGEGMSERYSLDKPSSDNCISFYSFAKEQFGADVAVQQCGQHLSGTRPFHHVSTCHPLPLVVLFTSHCVLQEAVQEVFRQGGELHQVPPTCFPSHQGPDRGTHCAPAIRHGRVARACR